MRSCDFKGMSFARSPCNTKAKLAIKGAINKNLTEVSFLKREDAFYHKLMLMTGLDDDYDEWLNCYLESENPLSDVVLELACCGADVNKTISVLHNFCGEQSFDEAVVCDRVRTYFKDAYYEKRRSKEEILPAMYRLALNVGDPGDFDIHLWGSMYYLDEYYSLAKDGIIFWERFDFAFFSYLDNGIPVDFDRIWDHNQKKKVSFIDKIKLIFKR